MKRVACLPGSVEAFGAASVLPSEGPGGTAGPVRILQYEVREGREAVMPGLKLELDLAECEDLCSLQEGGENDVS